MVSGVGEFELDGSTSAGSQVSEVVVDSTFFRFLAFLSILETSSSSHRRFFFLFFLSFSTSLPSILPSVSNSTVAVSTIGSSTRAGWKPSMGAESTSSSVGSSEFALSLLSKFSKSRFCFHAIPSGSLVCCAPTPSMSSL